MADLLIVFKFGKLIYFMNSCTKYIQAFCLIFWSTFSLEHGFGGCPGIIEGHSNESEKWQASQEQKSIITTKNIYLLTVLL